MEILLLSIIGLIAAVCGCVYYYKKVYYCPSDESEDEDTTTTETKNELSQIYSRILADSCVIKKDYTRPEKDESLDKNDKLHQELWENLRKVNSRTAPITREPNDMDNWFIEHIDDICRYGDTLAYVEHYLVLSELLIAHLNNPDVDFQRKLISVSMKRDQKVVKLNYVNLLCLFCLKHDLLPEIKAVALLDPRFETAKKIYELYHV